MRLKGLADTLGVSAAQLYDCRSSFTPSAFRRGGHPRRPEAADWLVDLVAEDQHVARLLFASASSRSHPQNGPSRLLKK
jgi:hypothetical protein